MLTGKKIKEKGKTVVEFVFICGVFFLKFAVTAAERKQFDGLFDKSREDQPFPALTERGGKGKRSGDRQLTLIEFL